MQTEDNPRTLEEVQASLRDRLIGKKAPFHVTDAAIAAQTIESLTGVDGESWGAAWAEAGRKLEEQAKKYEEAGQLDQARDAFFRAYGLYHVGRYPVPNHPKKQTCYEKSRDCFLKAGSLLEHRIERVSVPFSGREGEGKEVAFYVRRHVGAGPRPVVIRWSGIDTWKEERKDIDDKLFAAGLSVITMDMPGTGESPVLVSPDGDRQFLPVLDWIERQPEFDARRIAIIGMSWGGYWATKLAYMYPERIAAAVNWGGPVHHGFTREWLLQSKRASSYLMEIQQARARCVGKQDYESYIEAASHLSLLDAGLLDGPHARMLLVNGDNDKQQPFEDFKLLVTSGSPKAMRLFPGGHMGYTPLTIPTVVDWVEQALASEPSS